MNGWLKDFQWACEESEKILNKQSKQRNLDRLKAAGLQSIDTLHSSLDPLQSSSILKTTEFALPDKYRMIEEDDEQNLLDRSVISLKSSLRDKYKKKKKKIPDNLLDSMYMVSVYV
jgi:hypothetical protein